VIPLPLQIVIALVLDALWGDPRWLPHPVQGIGRLALALETPLRRLIANERLAGAITAILVISITAGSCSLLLFVAGSGHPLLDDLVAILIMYTCLAARDLSRHALEVKEELDAGDLVTARQRVAMLVGRDTGQLDEAEVSRAAVESVAENTVDAVTAPLLFALLAGPVGAMVYKAINTLDSTFGYKNDRYLHFGCFSARLDDLVNFIPARLTALLTPPAAALINLDAWQAWRIFKRDRKQHPSPNSGQIEAAMAGALNVRLGGESSYFGQSSFRPHLGDSGKTLCARHIGEAVHLMWTTSLLTGAIGLLCWIVFQGLS
jgi:adenosylcobinamide-phosphate synthase